jgi:hypothetical protein
MSTDCLVLKIEEYVDKNLDTTLYILYDKNEEFFLIRGKRSDNLGNYKCVPYSFYCKHITEITDFIDFIICKDSKISYTLYNYNDLSNDSDNIDFDYLHNLDNKLSFEISGYDNQKFNKNNITKFLKVLKNVFNYY